MATEKSSGLMRVSMPLMVFLMMSGMTVTFMSTSRYDAFFSYWYLMELRVMALQRVLKISTTRSALGTAARKYSW